MTPTGFLTWYIRNFESFTYKCHRYIFHIFSVFAQMLDTSDKFKVDIFKNGHNYFQNDFFVEVTLKQIHVVLLLTSRYLR